MGNAMKYDRITSEELTTSIQYIDQNHESQRVLIALRHWPSGAELLKDARQALDAHQGNADNCTVFMEKVPIAEAIATKCKDGGADGPWHAEFIGVCKLACSLMQDTSSAYKSMNQQSITRMSAALFVMRTAMTGKFRASIDEKLQDLSGNPTTTPTTTTTYYYYYYYYYYY